MASTGAHIDSSTVKRRQTVSPPGIAAGGIALAKRGQRSEVSAHRRPQIVDDAADALADFAAQGDAARWLTGRATHTDHIAGRLFGECRRHRRRSPQFFAGKTDAESGAAGAAAQADRHGPKHTAAPAGGCGTAC